MSEYTIHGNNEGQIRLEVLSRALAGSTTKFLQSADISWAKKVLDLGCGNGSVSFELAALLGKEASVLGLDLNDLNIQAASQRAQYYRIAKVHFEKGDAYQLQDHKRYDLIYSRFLVSHLSHPEKVLDNALRALKLILLLQIRFPNLLL